jgi:protease-4
MFSLDWLFHRRPKLSNAPIPENIDPSLLKDAMGEALIADLIAERRSNRSWTQIRRILLGGSGVVLFGIYVFFYATNLGYKFVPNSHIVGVVRITGSMEEGSQTGSANAVIAALNKAFNKPNVDAIVLAIDSGGGQPAEAERIYNYLDLKRNETKKPVYAVIGNIGASAAYMVAIHTDKIYAGKYSLVGSIGAKMDSWNVHKVVERFDVERKVFASGKLKSMLDPFSPGSDEADAKAQTLVTDLGHRFAKEVRELRGTRLVEDPSLFTGEVWNGERALELGLIDGVDTLDSLVKTTWSIGYYDFGPNKSSSGFSLPFTSFADAFVQAITDALALRLQQATLPN